MDFLDEFKTFLEKLEAFLELLEMLDKVLDPDSLTFLGIIDSMMMGTTSSKQFDDEVLGLMNLVQLQL
jgi:hypothetical protein